MFFARTIRFCRDVHRLARVPRKSPEYIEQLRQQRLRQLLQHAVKAPFFRERYQGVNVSQFQLSQLSQLPTTNKQELMAHFDQAVTDPGIRGDDVARFIADRGNLGRLFRGRYAVSQTSGSQGQPLMLVQNRRCLEILFGIMASRASALGKPGLLEGLRRLIRPVRLAIVTTRRGFFPSGAAFEFMPAMAGPFIRMTQLSSMQPDLIDRLNRFRPNSLFAYPSVLDWLALQQGLRLAPHLRQVSCSSEKLSDGARQRIQQAFGVPVFDHYATGECLFLSDGCPTDGGAHVNADWAILEVLDQAGRPVPAGQPGAKVLITNLANTVQPIIRYEVGDAVTMANRPCRCGSRLPWIERIDGRAAEVFWIAEGTEQMINSLLFKSVADYLHQVRTWQVVQQERTRLEVRLELLPGMVLDQATAERVVLQKLSDLGIPPHVKVTVRIVPSLGPDPRTGKFRRFISLIDPPSVAA